MANQCNRDTHELGLTQIDVEFLLSGKGLLTSRGGNTKESGKNTHTESTYNFIQHFTAYLKSIYSILQHKESNVVTNVMHILFI